MTQRNDGGPACSQGADMKRPDPWLHHKALPPEAQQRLRDAAATMRVLSGWRAKQKCLDEAIGSVQTIWPDYFHDNNDWTPPSAAERAETWGKKQ